MQKIRLAIDVASGDYGAKVIIAGLLEAYKRTDNAFLPYLCGDKEEIIATFESFGEREIHKHFKIEHCTQQIQIHDQRASVWKKYEQSSIIRSISLQKEGKVDASISAGDTAILLSASLFILGRNENVKRPALAAILPTTKKKPVLLLDVGANLNCRAEHLVAFGMMGSEYMARFFDYKVPTVGLLNIGKESIKGTNTIQDADKSLKQQCSGYKGFVEGNHVLTGDVDVVVCDGFTGNVLLKMCESFHELARSILGNDIVDLESLKKRMESINPDNYGAVPFLGIKGTVLKAHGGSKALAITNAILTTMRVVERNAVWRITAKPKGILES